MCKVNSSTEELVKLLEKSYSQFVARAFYYTKDIILAEDLLQDVLTEILTKVNLDKITSQKGFIIDLINKRGIDFCRKKKILFLEFSEALNLKDQAKTQESSSILLNKILQSAELNKEELDLLEDFKQGYTNKEIAKDLGMTTNEVRTKKQAIFRKLRRQKRI